MATFCSEKVSAAQFRRFEVVGNVRSSRAEVARDEAGERPVAHVNEMTFLSSAANV